MVPLRNFLRAIPESTARLDGQPLSVRMFRLTSLVSAFLCLFFFWPVNLFEPDVPKSATGMIIGLGLLSGFIFFESRKDRNHIAVFLTATIVVIDFVWFNNGGFAGGVPLFFPTLMILPLVFYTDGRRWAAMILMGVNFCVIWLLSSRFPQ
jgi:hypothetical protein